MASITTLIFSLLDGGNNLSLPYSFIAFIASSVSFILSVIVFFDNRKKFKKEIKGELKIEYKFSNDNTTSDITVSNSSHRPVTVLSYDLLYGASDFYFQTINSYVLDPPVKMTEADIYKIVLRREEIKKLVSENKIEQKYYHRLMLRIHTSSSGTFIFDVTVPKNMIEGKCSERAERFIAADIFLGFPKKESIYYPQGNPRYK